MLGHITIENKNIVKIDKRNNSNGSKNLIHPLLTIGRCNFEAKRHIDPLRYHKCYFISMIKMSFKLPKATLEIKLAKDGGIRYLQ